MTMTTTTRRMKTTIGIFVSSVQKELNEERAAIRDYIRTDPLLRIYFEPFLFEDLPALDQKPDQLYLDEVDRCSIYLGIFGNEYGPENELGFSPTELEFERATEKGRYRLIFVKGKDDSKRHPKMRSLITRATPRVVRKRFTTCDDLKKELYAALVQFLCDSKIITCTPFDESSCPGATLADISDEKVAWFVPVAKKERGFPLNPGTPTEQVLKHLDLLEESQPTNAAILLFGIKPRKFLPASEIKCMHYHGTVVAKPIPSHQIFTGTLFDQVDQATDFVLSKINRVVPPRDSAPVSETRYEIPKEVIQEAVVNAVAHRDYTSAASVQVSVFSDRIEVRNPGSLPSDLTFEDLKIEHNSRPRNHRIALPLYFTHYIEKIGYGTIQMTNGCRDAGLPEPEFSQRGGEFVVTLWRDWLTDTVLAEFRLNERQKKIITFLKSHARITNAECQSLTGAARKAISRDLGGLVDVGLLVRIGERRGVYYVLARGTRKGAI
ncbi:MAG: ATP-binding protein [Methanoregula sp.]|jgi:predicted HTH transcriptional regulator